MYGAIGINIRVLENYKAIGHINTKIYIHFHYFKIDSQFQLNKNY